MNALSTELFWVLKSVKEQSEVVSRSFSFLSLISYTPTLLVQPPAQPNQHYNYGRTLDDDDNDDDDFLYSLSLIIRNIWL